MVECQFLIPLTRDAEISDGQYHTSERWEWLDDALVLNFSGRTIAPGRFEGLWRSAKTRTTMSDESILYIVAVPQEDVDRLRHSPEAGMSVVQAAMHLLERGRTCRIRRGRHKWLSQRAIPI